MSRTHPEVTLTPIALRRSEAAAVCGVSVEVFDKEIRPHVPVARLGGRATVYLVDGLRQFLAASSSSMSSDLGR
jgi:hypothetical protein